MSTASSELTIQQLRSSFAHFGLPQLIVLDNGSCFTSSQFRTFLKENGVEQITTAPYHPSSNGLAERMVQVVRQGLRKSQ